VPVVRLNAYLARAGIASRRKSDELILAGRVAVNGEPGELNTFVSPDDRVTLDGRAIEEQPPTYLLLYKPAGTVTTARDPQGRPTVVDLVPSDVRVVPVGRLAHRLAHPRYQVDKVYVADVDGAPSDDDLATLAAGIELDDGVTAPARVRRLGASRVELTLHEGRKHQVKRMCEAVGHPVRRLHRSSYAGLTLRGLEPGRYRELGRDEVERLRASVARAPVPRRRGRP
jgi:23S rRNA pseudouridine2605 synthase